jgi:hypothetical protein
VVHRDSDKFNSKRNIQYVTMLMFYDRMNEWTSFFVFWMAVTTVDSGSKALEFLGLCENDETNTNTPSVFPNNHQVWFCCSSQKNVWTCFNF